MVEKQSNTCPSCGAKSRLEFEHCSNPWHREGVRIVPVKSLEELTKPLMAAESLLHFDQVMVMRKEKFDEELRNLQVTSPASAST